MFVEQDTPPLIPVWADNITLKVAGETLSICGETRITTIGTTDQRRPSAKDLLQQYAESRRSPKVTLSPHLQFANADSESKLIDFVRRYGPVWGRVRMEKVLPNNKHTMAKIWAEESLKGLRREQWLFSRIVKLYALIANNNGHGAEISQILSDLVRVPSSPPLTMEVGLNDWYGWQFLRRLNQSFEEEIGCETDSAKMEAFLRQLTSDQIREAGRQALTLFLNIDEFSRILVIPYGGRFTEVPIHNPRGVLPALFYMLRQDCLYDRGISMCARPECGVLFPIERYKQRFCSQDCSQRQRQREYYIRRGKRLRRKRPAPTRRAIQKKRG